MTEKSLYIILALVRLLSFTHTQKDINRIIFMEVKTNKEQTQNWQATFQTYTENKCFLNEDLSCLLSWLGNERNFHIFSFGLGAWKTSCNPGLPSVEDTCKTRSPTFYKDLTGP